MATCPTCRTQYPNDLATCSVDGAALLPDEAFLSIDRELVDGEAVGEYRIQSKLGEGGFGAVYRAVHPLIGKIAAIKVLGRQFSSNPQMVSRFIAEARAVNQIRHRNIIDIFAFGTLDDGRQYYIMELLDGEPFDAYLRRRGRLSVEEALPILRGVARAVDAAHQNGIAHRDLKPENVFVVIDEDGRATPKLLDFGIAKLLTDPSGGHKTKTGTPMGTPYFMSPEQCYGKDVDHRTDIYALGVMTYQVLTGHLPFTGETTMEILVKHMSAVPDAPSAREPGVPTSLDAPILQMMAKSPDQRPPTMLAGIDGIAAAVGQPASSVAGAPLSVAYGPMSAPADSRMRVTPAAITGDPSADPGVQTFLATSVTPAAEAPPPKKSRVPLVVAGVAGLLALGVGVVALGVVLNKPSGTVQATGLVVPPPSVTALPSVQPTATQAATTAPQPPESHLITLTGAPKGLKAYRGSEILSLEGATLKLPHGTAEMELTFKAPGYKPWTAKVTPDHDINLDVTMEKVGGGPAPAGPAPHGTVHKDLEGFPH